MKITKQILPLFNEMYGFRISEEALAEAFFKQEEFLKKAKISKEILTYQSVSNIKYIIENDITTITHTLFLDETWREILEVTVKNKETEEIEEKEKEALTNLSIDSYFMIPFHEYTFYVKNIHVDDLCILLENLKFCELLEGDILNNKERKKINPYNILDDLSEIIQFTSGPRMLEKIKLNELNEVIINTSKKTSKSFNDIESLCNWLMPHSKISSVPDNTLNETLLKFNNRELSIGYIKNVYEKDNYRLGIIAQYTNNYYSQGVHGRIFLLSHEDTLFNYADVNRVILFNNSFSGHNTAIQLNKNYILGKVLFTEDVILPKPEVLLWVIDSFNNNDSTLLWDSSELKLHTNKFSEELRREKEAQEEKEILKVKLANKLKSLKTNKKILILNGMNIQNDKIEYNGQILSSTGTDWVYDILYSLSRAHEFDDINWDAVFEQFIWKMSNYLECEGQLGEVKFKLNNITTTNVSGIESTKMYLNEYRINKNEIRECLRRAICYTTQEDYNEFLSNVSNCSLKFHRYLQAGVEFEVSGMRYNEGFIFKLPLERRKNLMYIVLGGNEYKVKDTNKLISITNIRDLGEIVELFLGDKVIEGMTLNDVKTVIKLAKIEYQDGIEKSNKLLTETEKTLKLSKQQNIQMEQVTVNEGYIVNGKLRQYVVANTDKCEVYEYPSGRYICIVDKSTSQIGKDKLINRLYALTNDQALVHDIHTLN